MDKEKTAGLVASLIDILTFKRVILVAILAALLIALYVSFEHRSTLFTLFYKNAEPATAPVNWELSPESKKQLTDLTQNPLIGIVSFIAVDLKKNKKTLKFIHTRDSDLTAMAPKVLGAQPALPLFDYDSKNTAQVVAMLNNQFLCVPTADTSAFRNFPVIGTRYPTTCKIAVPPFFGDLAGYLNILLTRELSEVEIDTIRLEANRTAVEIYIRDVAKSENDNK